MLVYDQYIYPEKPDIDDDIVVFHSGFCSTAPNYSYGKDTRDYYLIHYVTKGKGVYATPDHSYELIAYDGFLIKPNETIVHTADSEDPWDLCWVAFFGRKAEELVQAAGLSDAHMTFHYEEDDFLETCIKNIYNESRTTRNIATITGYFYLFLGKLIEINATKFKKQSNVITFSHFDDAIVYIKRNIRNQVSIEHLANYLRMDPSQVYRIFKKNTGKSPYQYIAQLRIEKACDLLIKTDLSIREISEWMDFEYQSHFTKQFKNITGINPSEYRAIYQDKGTDI